MSNKYSKYIKEWDNIFSKSLSDLSISSSSGHEDLDKAIEWICNYI